MPRWTKILLVNVALTVLLLTAVEGVSRRLAPTPLPQPLVADDNERWLTERRFHPLLFWQPTARRDADGEVVINELGLRGPLPGEKGPDEYRILSLGESTTAAMRLPLEQTYSSVLERELPRFHGRTVRVVNAGVGGYSLAQGVTLLRLHGLALDPDMVLTYFGYNDFLRVGFRARRDALAARRSGGLTDRELLELRSRPSTRLALWLLRHSNLARLLASGRESLPVRRGRKVRVPAADRLAFYRELDRLCAERGIRLVVLIPVYRRFDRHLRLLREMADSGRFEVVDLPRLLADELEPRAPLFFDRVHPRAPVHAAIGRAVADHLRASDAQGSASSSNPK